MACAAFETTLGDSKAVLQAILTDNEVPYPLGAATAVHLRVRKKQTRTHLFTRPGAFHREVAGKVYYEFTGSEFPAAGIYEGQWVVTFPDGELTFPAGQAGFEIAVADRF